MTPRKHRFALITVGNGNGQNVGPGRQLLAVLGRFKGSELNLAKRDRLRYHNKTTIICRLNSRGVVDPNLAVT